MPRQEILSVAFVRDSEALQALAHPVRLQVLEALRAPATAASVARDIGHARQKVNYHLKELERVGLVERVEERRKGNFIESVYRSVARTFVVSPEVAWADPRRFEALRSQHALETLVVLGERLQSDTAALLDRAAFDGEQISSAAAEAELRFRSEDDRKAFMDDYLLAMRELLDKHGAKDGEPYRVILAVYPKEETG